MNKLVFEPFDSSLWKKWVYKLHVGLPFPDATALRSLLARSRPDLVYAFVPFFHSIMETMEQVGFHLISLRTAYRFVMKKEVEMPILPNSFRVFSLVNDIRLSYCDLQEMAVTIGGTSRYFHDTRIKEQEALDLYVAWIRNSLYHMYAKEAFMIFQGERLAGLITLKIKDGSGIIDLLGVLPSFQRNGLGSFLLNRAMSYFQAQGIQNVLVVTEGENIKASAFYQRHGFLLSDLSLVYHAHL